MLSTAPWIVQRCTVHIRYRNGSTTSLELAELWGHLRSLALHKATQRLASIHRDDPASISQLAKVYLRSILQAIDRIEVDAESMRRRTLAWLLYRMRDRSRMAMADILEGLKQ